jgi:hypothetical protein
MLNVQANLLFLIHGNIEWLDSTFLHFALTYIHPTNPSSHRTLWKDTPEYNPLLWLYSNWVEVGFHLGNLSHEEKVL